MSTRSALTIVGGVVGAYFGYPQLGLAIGALVGGAVDPQTIQGPKIGEVAAQTSAEGAPRTIVYGTIAVYGNVIQTGPLIKTTDTETQGKGGPVAENEVAYRTYAVRICEGPIGGVLRVWADNKLVYDVRPGSLMLAESAAWAQWVFFHMGDESQLPDVFLTANVNADTPAYRGSAYAVFLLQDLTDRRGSIPQYRFEVAAVTSVGEILGPLVVNPWASEERPTHSIGDTKYFITGTPSGTSYTDFETAAASAAAIAAAVTPAAATATNFTDYTTSTQSLPSGFTGGATLTDDPQYVYYQQAYVGPDEWGPVPATSGYIYCSALEDDFAAVPDDGKAYGNWVTGTISYDGFRITRLVSDPTLPGGASDPWNGGGNNCINYSPTAYAQSTPVVPMAVERAPSVPSPSWTKVTGTAKQLAAIEYRSGVLFQNGLGPVLLPGDPNYSNATFWDAARDAAVLAGTMDAGVSSWPAVVSEYATGTETLAGEPVGLGAIVSDIHSRCDIDAGNYDVTELEDLVSGLALAGDYTGADAINSVRPLYFFDKSEHDRKLWYPKRGAAVTDSWDIDDLTEVPDSTQREQALEIPKKLHLFYQHAISGYARVKATAASSSPDLMTTGEVTIEVPVVLNEDQAAQAADKAYKVTRAEINGTTEISIPLDIGIERVPSNPVGLTLRGSTRRLRIDSMSYADGVFKLSLKNDRQSAYTSNLTGVPIPPPTLPPSTIVGETVFAVLDIAARVDSEDDLNYLVAVTGESPAWHGARYQRSLDTGANWTTVQDITTASIIGYLQDDVPSASEDYTDTTNSVTVRLIREGQTIDSLTEAQFLSEQGAFALEKDDGSFEIMQYLDAHEDSSGDFTLTTLHRGLLNSGASEHLSGARFVMLARPTHINAQASWIGQDLTHRAISLGDTADNTDNEETATFVGRSQLEWPVASFVLTRSGNNVTGTWVPRHRFGSDDYPVASVNFEGYRVTIVGTSTVTFDQTAQTFTYDVSAIGGSVTVSVSALNRITGAGPATSGTI